MAVNFTTAPCQLTGTPGTQVDGLAHRIAQNFLKDSTHLHARIVLRCAQGSRLHGFVQGLCTTACKTHGSGKFLQYLAQVTATLCHEQAGLNTGDIVGAGDGIDSEWHLFHFLIVQGVHTFTQGRQ